MASAVFTISQTEIDRRISAFTALLVSLYTGLTVLMVLAFPALIFANLALSTVIALVLFVLFAGSRAMTVGFFRNFLKTRVILTGRYLERKSVRSDETYALADITGVTVKQTSHGPLREIGISLSDGRHCHFDGLDDFDRFRDALLPHIGRHVTVTVSHEPIDFDSTLFYPILGILLSIASVGGLKLLAGLNYGHLRIVYLVFAVYILTLGSYFFIRRPLSVQYGYASAKTDILIGLVMAGIAIVILFPGRTAL